MLGLLFWVLGGATAGYTVSQVALAKARQELRQRIVTDTRSARALAPAEVRRIVDAQLRRAVDSTGLTRARVDAAYALARRAGVV